MLAQGSEREGEVFEEVHAEWFVEIGRGRIGTVRFLAVLEFRVKLEEGVERLEELLANLIFAAFDEVHAHVSLFAIFQRNFRILNPLQFICW
jgi:hypothetical protein